MNANARPRTGVPWWLLGLTAALALFLARVVLLVGLEHFHHGVPWDLFLRRLERGAPQQVSVALGLGLALAVAGRLAAPASRRLLGALAWLFGGLAGGALVAGWIASDGLPEHRLGTDTNQGLVANAAVLIAGWVLGAIVVGLARRSAGAGSPRRAVAAAGLTLALLLLAAPLTGLLARAARPPLELTEVVLDVPSTEGAWSVVSAPEGLEPTASMLTPSALYEFDGAGMRSLIVPAGSTVEFRVPGNDGYLWLDARAGFGPRMVIGATRRKQRALLRYRIEVDGEEVWRLEQPVFGVGRGGASEWQDVGGEHGLLLAPGATVQLSTELCDMEGEPLDWRGVKDGGLEPSRAAMLSDVGFGGVVLERRRQIERSQSSPERPNVVLVLMDTLRADRLGAYGYERPTSPRLDALARRGLIAERSYSTSSWTWPSTASVLTGRLPEEHGVVSHNACFLEHGYDTLAEALARVGISTGAFSGNPLIVPDKNFDQGFEVFQHGKAGILESDEVLPGALEWIEDHAGERFFAYIHLTDPHAPLKPQAEARALLAPNVPRDFSPVACNKFHDAALAGVGRDEEGHLHLDEIASPEERQWVNDLYDACVHSGDARLGEVLDTLERLGLTDQTIVAFTSDHGEELFDHGLVTHGQSVHQELVRVPLVVAGPGVPAGARLDEPISNRHLAPTLAKLAGAEIEGGYESFDLVDRIEADAAEDLLLFHTSSGWWQGTHPTNIYGLQQGRLVLHWAPWSADWGEEEPPTGGSLQMFDLMDDPGEHVNLADVDAEDAQALQRRIGELRLMLEKRRVTAATIGVGEDTLRMLRAIGYIGDD